MSGYDPPSSAPATSAGFSLRADAVSFSYGEREAVRGVSLTLRSGEVVAIVGPNGCGKSTLLRMLCGQLLPAAGKITVRPPAAGGPEAETRNIATLAPGDIARLMALVPQSTAVGFDYSARQMVLMARWPTHAQGGLATALGFETPADYDLADRAMWAMDVHHLADRPITQLSGGERQRVIIARALAQQTPALLLDEPANSLDLWHQLELFSHLRLLASAKSRAVLMVTHDLNHALAYADRALVMDGGRVVAEGPAAAVLTPATLEPVYRVRVAVGSSQVLTFARKPS